MVKGAPGPPGYPGDGRAGAGLVSPPAGTLQGPQSRSAECLGPELGELSSHRAASFAKK